MGRTVNLHPWRSLEDILFEAGIRRSFMIEGIDNGVGAVLQDAVEPADPFAFINVTSWMR